MGKSNDEIEVTQYLCEKIPELNNFKREKKKKFGMKFKNEIYEIVKKNNDNECIQKYNILCSYKKSLTPIKMVNGNNEKLKAISLFSGMGGDSLGIKKAGLELVAYSEWEKEMKETHDMNFKNCKYLGDGDITKTDDKEFLQYKNKVDLIFAGFLVKDSVMLVIKIQMIHEIHYSENLLGVLI